MTPPRDDPAASLGAGAVVPQRSAAGCVGEAWAVLRQWELDAEDVEVRVHVLRDTAGYTAGSVLLMVANRRERGCRTYLCQPGLPGWKRDFAQDLAAGIFGGTPPAPAVEALLPPSPILVHDPFSKRALS